MSFETGYKPEDHRETPAPPQPSFTPQPTPVSAQPNPQQTNRVAPTQTRYMDCHTPTAFGIPGFHHRYMYDNATGKQYGKGDAIEEHEDGSHKNKTVRPGPYGGTDSCAFIQAAYEDAKKAWQGQKKAVREESQLPPGLPGLEGKRSWAPYSQDCHRLQDDVLESNGLPSGGTRVGPMPKGVSEADAKGAREELLKQKQEKGGSK